MSMGMVETGHIAHAKAMFGQTYHLAWGKLPPGYVDPWDLGETPPIPLSQIVTETVTRNNNAGKLDQLANTGIISVLSVTQGGTTYNVSTDFNLNGRSIDWTPAGAEPTHNTTYTVIYRYNTPAITSLLSELGRRDPSIKGYCVPDVNGDIVANNAQWALTASGGTVPSRHIYLQFKFDATDAVGQIIHQLGLFIGTTKQAGVPSGQKYLAPADVLSPGDMYMIENTEPFSRFAGKREIFEYVVTF